MVETCQYLGCREIRISPVKQQPHVLNPFPYHGLSIHEHLHLHKARTQVQGLCLKRTKIGPAAPSLSKECSHLRHPSPLAELRPTGIPPLRAAAAPASRAPLSAAPAPPLLPECREHRPARSGPRLPPGLREPGAGGRRANGRRRGGRAPPAPPPPWGCGLLPQEITVSARGGGGGPAQSYDRPPAAPTRSRVTQPQRPRAPTRLGGRAAAAMAPPPRPPPPAAR